MAYLMRIFDKESGDAFDVSELFYNAVYTTTLQGQPGKLTFNLKKDPNNILQVSMGSHVQFYCDEIPIFSGKVFNMKCDIEDIYEITAYDQMRYLQNHDYYLLENKSLPEVFRQICVDGLQLTENESFKILGHAKTLTDNIQTKSFLDVSYFDILQYAINEENSKSVQEHVYNEDGTISFTKLNAGSESDLEAIPYKYFIRDNFGVLELNDIENNVKFRQTGIDGNYTRKWTGKEWYYYDESSREQLEPLIIGDESLLMNYNYQLDIDKNTYTELMLVSTTKNESKGNKKSEDVKKLGKSLVFYDRNTNQANKWGVLRKIINLKKSDATQQEIDEYGKLSLLEGSQINKTLKIDSLGYNGVNAGDGFLLEIKKLGIREMVYVISATHNYDCDKHTMHLEVSTSRNLTEVLK